ncbi:MAG: hypothetical protein KIT20_15390 [Alphaproteobacteria bacterium]|nr:hypothetical protein [Alphaproteobacteria bacterium]
MSASNHLLLRRVLLADAIASAGAGLALALLSGMLADMLMLPAALLFWAGVSLIPFAALVLHVSRRDPLPRGAVLAIVAYNLLWTLDSVLILALGWVEPNAIGAAFVLAQAAGVAAIAGLQYLGLQRAPVPA